MPSTLETINKIEGFQNLPAGWRFGEGGPIAPQIIQQAVRWVRMAAALGFVRSNAFASVDGEIVVCLYLGDKMIEITIELDGSLTYALDIAGEQVKFEEGYKYVHPICPKGEDAETCVKCGQALTNGNWQFTGSHKLHIICPIPKPSIGLYPEKLWLEDRVRAIDAAHKRRGKVDDIWLKLK